jgi:transposase
VLRAPALRQPPAVQAAYATIAATQIHLLSALAGQIPALEEVLAQGFGRHPDAEIYTSLPGLGVVLGARVLSEFGDDPHRYQDARARKHYAGTSPITRASGRNAIVLARYAVTAAWTTRSTSGPLRPDQLIRCPRLLRHPARARDRSPRSAAPAREPRGRHPARLP